jgi:hypothetical protein
MVNRPSDRRQLDLLVRAADRPEQPLPPAIRAEVTLLLKLLIAESVGAGTVLPVEAVGHE